VGYLTARDLHLQFAVLPRPGVAADALELVWQALDYALQWLGAGGKTAQGFGTMQSQVALLSQSEEKWERPKPKFNRANKSLSVETKDGQTAIALAPKGEALLQTLPADMQQKIKTNQFVKITAYVAEGVLLRIEKA
jgi:CRISPR-associated protein Cmr6